MIHIELTCRKYPESGSGIMFHTTGLNEGHCRVDLSSKGKYLGYVSNLTDTYHITGYFSIIRSRKLMAICRKVRSDSYIYKYK